MSNVESPQVKFILEWGQGFEKKDAGILSKGLHKDFQCFTYPKSVNQPVKNKEEWVGHLSVVFPSWASTEHTQHSIIDAPGKVIYHFTQKTKTNLGIDVIYEAITIAHIVTDEDGSLKIGKIEEFIDSKSYLDFMEAVAAKSK